MKILNIRAVCAVMVLVSLISTPAKAGDARAGLMFQDINIAGVGGVQGKEKSEGLSLDYVFDSPGWLDWAPLKPRPYVGGTVNLGGKTNYGGAGLLVQPKITRNFYGELGFGVVAHDGTLEIPQPDTGLTPEAGDALDVRNANEIEFGSRILFRSEFALGYRVSEDWAVEVVYEHLSHGKVLSSGSNEGLDAAGIRVARRF